MSIGQPNSGALFDGVGNANSATKRTRILFGITFPLVLFLTALLLGSWPGKLAFTLGSAVGGAIGLYSVYVLAFSPEHLRFGRLMGTGLLLGYALGAFNTTIQMQLKSVDITDRLPHAIDDLAIAMAVVLAACALLFFVSGLGEHDIVRGLDCPVGQRERRTIWVGIAMVAVAYAMGDLGYMGQTTSEDHHISVLGGLASLLAPILPGLTLYCLRRTKAQVERWKLMFALGIELIALLPTGRRVLLYAIVLACMAFHLESRVPQRVSASRKMLTRRLALLLAGSLIVYAGFVGFWSIRWAVWQMGNQHTLVDYVEQAAENLQSGDTKMSSELSTNLEERTFIIGYFSDLLAASSQVKPMFGEDALFCVKMIVPSALYPDKQDIVDIGQEENIANPHFGLRAVDEANSILTSGVCDFGFVGALLYPLVIIAMFAVFLWLVPLPPFLRLATCFCFIYHLLLAETTLSSYFLACRDLLIALPLLWLIMKFPTLQLRSLAHANTLSR